LERVIMITIGIDPAARTGIAMVRDGVLVYAAEVAHVDEARGVLDLLARLRDLSRPDLVVIERPSYPRIGGVLRYGELRERAGACVALVLAVWPAVRVLRPWPTPHKGEPGWQPEMHAGHVEQDPKLRSVAEVVRRGGGQVIMRGGRAMPDAADAACMAWWGESQ